MKVLVPHCNYDLKIFHVRFEGYRDELRDIRKDATATILWPYKMAIMGTLEFYKVKVIVKLYELNGNITEFQYTAFVHKYEHETGLVTFGILFNGWKE